MTLYFLDSSALVKRYVQEAGTSWVQEITAAGVDHEIAVARMAWVEVLSALLRRQREDNLPRESVGRSIEAFRYDWETQYLVVELERAVTEWAGELVQRHILRAYDAVQLASALHLQALLAPVERPTFLSADARLIKAANSEGMSTGNPNDHPEF